MLVLNNAQVGIHTYLPWYKYIFNASKLRYEIFNWGGNLK